MKSRLADTADKVIKENEWTEDELKRIKNFLSLCSILRRAPRYLFNSALISLSRRAPIPFVSKKRVRLFAVDGIEISQCLYELKIIDKDTYRDILASSHAAVFASFF